MITNSILACPNLAGNYARCTSSTGDNSNSFDIVVSQKNENGMMIFTVREKDAVTGEEESTIMIADGKIRTMQEKDPETGITYIQKESYTCQGDQLVGTMSVQIDGEIVLNISMNTKKSGTEMISDIKGSSMGAKIEDLVTCK